MGGRFKGWTAAEVEKAQKRIFGGVDRQVENFINPKHTREGFTGILALEGVKETPRGKKPDYPAYIYEALKQIGIPSVREYRFIKDRRFRLDIAIPKHKIAIEFEGIGTGGRHQRIKGYDNDTKKYNLLTMHGWSLFRYTTVITKKKNWEYIIAGEIKQFIEKESK